MSLRHIDIVLRPNGFLGKDGVVTVVVNVPAYDTHEEEASSGCCAHEHGEVT